MRLFIGIIDFTINSLWWVMTVWMRLGLWREELFSSVEVAGKWKKFLFLLSVFGVEWLIVSLAEFMVLWGLVVASLFSWRAAWGAMLTPNNLLNRGKNRLWLPWLGIAGTPATPLWACEKYLEPCGLSCRHLCGWCQGLELLNFYLSTKKDLFSIYMCFGSSIFILFLIQILHQFE